METRDYQKGRWKDRGGAFERTCKSSAELGKAQQKLKICRNIKNKSL